MLHFLLLVLMSVMVLSTLFKVVDTKLCSCSGVATFLERAAHPFWLKSVYVLFSILVSRA